MVASFEGTILYSLTAGVLPFWHKKIYSTITAIIQ